MKPLLASLTILLLATAPGLGQVINGESIYEDNFQHTPPKTMTAEDTAAKDATVKGAKAPAPTDAAKAPADDPAKTPKPETSDTPKPSDPY